jgi:hypothetical protein
MEGFYSKFFLVPKKDRRLKTCHKSKTSKPVSPENTLQNGNPEFCDKPSSTRRLGNIVRFKRCLPSHSYLQKPQKIPEVLHSRCLLPICGPSIRTYSISPSVYKDNSCSNCISYLRHFGIRLANYLDGLVIVNQELKKLIHNKDLILNLLVELRFIINLKKSQLIPCQTITYI